MKITRSVCLEILEWCKMKYGKSTYCKQYPLLKFNGTLDQVTKRPKGLWVYKENRIYIYLKHNTDESNQLLEVVNTIIHEYTHYLQDSKEYHRLVKEVEYDKHPMELEANKIAYRDQYECYNHITQTLSSCHRS